MIRTLLALSVAAATVLSCATFVTASSQAAGEDRVQLRVDARGTDGALRFSTADGWSWRCSVPAACTVNPVRGTWLTITAENGAVSAFQAWEGACASSGIQPACTIQVNDNGLSATARFSPVRLWLPAFGPGSITVERAADKAPLGRPCGSDCTDIPNGETVRLRAVPRSGARMTAWGGACANVAADKNCLLTTSRGALVSATFESAPPPTRTCEPGKSCDPVGTAIEFTVELSGKGIVVAPRMAGLRELTCTSSGTRATCTMLRLQEKWIELKAYTLDGGRFLGWGGKCSGTGTCRFYNGRYRTGQPVITARFG